MLKFESLREVNVEKPYRNVCLYNHNGNIVATTKKFYIFNNTGNESTNT